MSQIAAGVDRAQEKAGALSQSRAGSGGFTPPLSVWRGKPAATSETETEALQTERSGRRGEARHYKK